MPDCYTHAHVATKALMRSGQTVASQPAFLAGANGPDPLYMYKSFAKNPQPDLPSLAKRMHRERAGAFMVALAQYAITPVQQSYALGYVTHYATDCTLHPYISAMSKKGMPYGMQSGHRRMEASLDSTLYYQDYKTYLVPLHAGTPVLITEDLAQVATLLHEAVLAAYGEDIPAVAFADTFHDNLKVRRFLISRRGFRRAFVKVFGAHYRDRRGKSSLAHRMQPAKPLLKLPDNWDNPYTGETLNITLEEVLALAEQTSAVCILAMMQFWLGDIDEAQMREIVGDNNLYTGMPSNAPEKEKKDPEKAE